MVGLDILPTTNILSRVFPYDTSFGRLSGKFRFPYDTSFGRLSGKFRKPKPYNTDPHYYWFLISFSLLSILLHIVPFSIDVLLSKFTKGSIVGKVNTLHIHNALYSANVLSLIGFTIIVALVPTGFYNMYAETFKHIAQTIGFSRVFVNKWINVYLINTVAWLIHFIPVYTLRNVYTLGNPFWWIIIYLCVFGIYLPKIYPLPLIILAPFIVAVLIFTLIIF